MSDWHCAMCGISLEDAIKRLNDPLTMSVDKYVDNVGKEDKIIAMYRANRVGNRKRKKVTCSKVCGSNYLSHLKTLDPIHTYTNKIIDCPLCHKTSEGGRQMIVGGKRTWICRSCHRKQITKDARMMWEELHRDERNAYRNQWCKDNPGKVRRQKRRARKRKGMRVLGRYGTGKWCVFAKECVACGTRTVPHRAYGFCRKCYQLLMWHGGYFK